MPIDINMDIFIPVFRLSFEERHNKADLVHILIKCLSVIVELRFDIEDKTLQIISISIEGSDIQPIRLVRPLLLLFQGFQLFLQPLDFVSIGLVCSFTARLA